MVAAVNSAVVDSGPTESSRDVPSTAYRVSVTTMAQSPVCGGRPASVE